MRLLSHELEANQPVVNEIVRRHRARFVIDLDKYDYPLPYIEIWPEIRGNLAPLININEFASLDDYYRQLQVLWDKKEGKRVPGAVGGKSVDELRLEQHAEASRRIIDKYADPSRRVKWLGF